MLTVSLAFISRASGFQPWAVMGLERNQNTLTAWTNEGQEPISLHTAAGRLPNDLLFGRSDCTPGHSLGNGRGSGTETYKHSWRNLQGDLQIGGPCLNLYGA